MPTPLILSENSTDYIIDDPENRLKVYENRLNSNGFRYSKGQWTSPKSLVKDSDRFKVIVQRVLDLEANPQPVAPPSKVEVLQINGEILFRGAKRLLKKVSDKLRRIGLTFDASRSSGPNDTWVASNLTSSKIKSLEDLATELNKIPLDAEPQRPTPNTSQYIRLQELDGNVWVSGPKHLMTSDTVYKKLKTQGFVFNQDMSMWVAPAHSLSALQRRNLDKVIEPYVEGGGGDLRTPKQRMEEEISNRTKNGWAIKIPFSLKDEAKALGGLWDEQHGTWCLPNAEAFAKILNLYENTPARKAQREIERRRGLNLGVTVPYDMREEASSRGGLWDPDGKIWYLPTQETKKEVLSILQKQREDMAAEIARKHIEKERVKAEEAEKIRLERERKGIVELHQSGRSREDHMAVGQIFRERRTGKILQVLEVKSYYIPEDGDSLGLDPGMDSGWLHTLYCAPPSPERQKAHEEKETVARIKAESRSQRIKHRETLENHIKHHGTMPSGSHHLHSPELLETDGNSRIYGGGSWFQIEPDGIWFVQNNGHDGDDWGYNNVQTGGAGAIGWKIPYNKTMAEEIETLNNEWET